MANKTQKKGGTKAKKVHPTNLSPKLMAQLPMTRPSRTNKVAPARSRSNSRSSSRSRSPSFLKRLFRSTRKVQPK